MFTPWLALWKIWVVPLISDSILGSKPLLSDRLSLFPLELLECGIMSPHPSPPSTPTCMQGVVYRAQTSLGEQLLRT